MTSLDLNTINTLLGVPSASVAKAVDDKIAECKAKLENAKFHSIPSPKIEYDLKGTTAGQAFGYTLIRLNLDLLNDPRYRDEMINQTVPHEFAHSMVSKLWPKARDHGQEWQLVCQVLGIEPIRCHNFDAKPARKTTRYKYHCHCPNGVTCGPKIHRKVQEDSVLYKCRKCNVLLISCKYTKVR